MKNSIVAFIVGVLFALGLGLGGMTQPQKIVGFLDVFGSWDPSLLFVMMGAVGVHYLSYKWIRKRKSPIFSMKWDVPEDASLTKALVTGAVIFGVGWGLSGFCPGPAIVSLASGDTGVYLFVASMASGMLLFSAVDKKVKIKL